MRRTRPFEVDTAMALWAVVAGSLALQVWGLGMHYGLRVIADTPTYIRLLRDLALAPLTPPASPFVAQAVNLPHATPDLQLLAFVWRALANDGVIARNLIDGHAAFEMLAIKGIAVTLLVFRATYVWSLREAGSQRVARLTVAMLPLVFGPALIISPGDLSFHGLMATADHSETLAIGLALYALVALDAPVTYGRLLNAPVLAALVMVTHPFTGVRFAALAAVAATVRVLSTGKRWVLTPFALVLGFAVASLWPAYNVSDAMKVGGTPGWLVVGALALVPIAAAFAGQGLPRVAWSRALPALDGPRVVRGLTIAGAVLVAAVFARELWIYAHPDPLLRTNRIAIYWNGPSTRFWPVLLAPGLVGFAGLGQLARRGRPLALLWALGCLAVAAAGDVGLPIPLWHRFAVFAEVPLALGLAHVLLHPPTPKLGRAAFRLACTSAILAVGALALAPQNVTYAGNALQAGWDFGSFVKPASGALIASDPVSSYFILPTGNRTLTMTMWHVGGASEAAPARAGYQLMRALYTGQNWVRAASRLYALGAHYVIVNSYVRMNEPTLERFSSFNVPYIAKTPGQLAEVNRYRTRIASVSDLIGIDHEYAIYRLDQHRLRRLRLSRNSVTPTRVGNGLVTALPGTDVTQ